MATTPKEKKDRVDWSPPKKSNPNNLVNNAITTSAKPIRFQTLLRFNFLQFPFLFSLICFFFEVGDPQKSPSASTCSNSSNLSRKLRRYSCWLWCCFFGSKEWWSSPSSLLLSSRRPSFRRTIRASTRLLLRYMDSGPNIQFFIIELILFLLPLFELLRPGSECLKKVLRLAWRNNCMLGGFELKFCHRGGRKYNFTSSTIIDTVGWFPQIALTYELNCLWVIAPGVAFPSTCLSIYFCVRILVVSIYL